MLAKSLSIGDSIGLYEGEEHRFTVGGGGGKGLSVKEELQQLTCLLARGLFHARVCDDTTTLEEEDMVW